MHVINIRLPEDMDNRLQILEDKTRYSKSSLIQDALKDYLDTHEKSLLRLAEYEEDCRNGTLQTTSLADLKKELGIQ